MASCARAGADRRRRRDGWISCCAAPSTPTACATWVASPRRLGAGRLRRSSIRIATVAMVPGGIFDLAGGALFGPYLGSVLDLLGGTLGAALARFWSRATSLRDWVEARAGPRLQRVMRSVDEDGWQFVAFLRLVPIFPYTHRQLSARPHAHSVPPLRDRHRGVHGALDGRLYLDRLMPAAKSSPAIPHQIRYALIALALLGAACLRCRAFSSDLAARSRISAANSRTACSRSRRLRPSPRAWRTPRRDRPPPGRPRCRSRNRVPAITFSRPTSLA